MFFCQIVAVTLTRSVSSYSLVLRCKQNPFMFITGDLSGCTVHVYCDTVGTPLPVSMQQAIDEGDIARFVTLFEECRALLTQCGGCNEGTLSTDGTHCVYAQECPVACNCGDVTLAVSNGQVCLSIVDNVRGHSMGAFYCYSITPSMKGAATPLPSPSHPYIPSNRLLFLSFVYDL